MSKNYPDSVINAMYKGIARDVIDLADVEPSRFAEYIKHYTDPPSMGGLGKNIDDFFNDIDNLRSVQGFDDTLKNWRRQLKGGDLHSADGFAAEIRVASRAVGVDNIECMHKQIPSTEIDILKKDGTIVEVKNGDFENFRDKFFNRQLIKFREFIANSQHPHAKIWLYVKDASIKAKVEAYLTAHSITDVIVFIFP
jgi:hypothetical protein